jgi:polysaccharide export outer membrane protein
MRSVLLALGLLFWAGAMSALAQSQPLQPGDTIQISVWQDPKLDRQVVVGPDGMIAFPLAGHIKVEGITTQALENLLRARLQKNYTEKLDVTVALASVNQSDAAESKPRIYISGEILKPGPYPAKPAVTVAQAISLAGGLSPFAASRRIQVHRMVDGTDTVLVFDYKAFQAGTQQTENFMLKPGDIIIVPERGLLE